MMEDVIRNWIKLREKHYHEVFNYFGEESEKFMVIDIEKDDIATKLSDFLGVEFIESNRIHNKSRNKISDVKEKIRDVDDVL